MVNKTDYTIVVAVVLFYFGSQMPYLIAIVFSSKTYASCEKRQFTMVEVRFQPLTIDGNTNIIQININTEVFHLTNMTFYRTVL